MVNSAVRNVVNTNHSRQLTAWKEFSSNDVGALYNNDFTITNAYTENEALADLDFDVPSLDDDINSLSHRQEIPESQRVALQAAVCELVKRAIRGELTQATVTSTKLFEKPAILQTRYRTSSAELDKQVTDLERVRTARNLVRTYQRRRGEVSLTEAEMDEVRAARRLVLAYDRRRQASLP